MHKPSNNHDPSIFTQPTLDGSSMVFLPWYQSLVSSILGHVIHVKLSTTGTDPMGTENKADLQVVLCPGRHHVHILLFNVQISDFFSSCSFMLCFRARIFLRSVFVFARCLLPPPFALSTLPCSLASQRFLNASMSSSLSSSTSVKDHRDPCPPPQ